MQRTKLLLAISLHGDELSWRSVDSRSVVRVWPYLGETGLAHFTRMEASSWFGITELGKTIEQIFRGQFVVCPLCSANIQCKYVVQ